MAQIFHPSTNTISKVSILVAVLFLLALGWIIAAINRSPYITQAEVTREQPVQFSHKHRVGDDGIDCRELGEVIYILPTTFAELGANRQS